MNSGTDIRGDSGKALFALRRILSDGVDRPDGRLPSEAQLCRRIGARRRCLRRAVDVLIVEGRVWRARDGHLYLNLPRGGRSPLDVPAALLEARLRIEPELAALAALRATPEDVRLMKRLAARTLASTDFDSQELWNSALHRFIAETADNALLLDAYGLIEDALARQTWRDASARGSRHEACRPGGGCGHAAVIESIAAADPEAAAESMRGHLLCVTRMIEIGRRTARS